MERFKLCCFCKEPMVEPYTNNPWPASTDPKDRCCGDCNTMVVIPARLAGLFTKQVDKQAN